jgi:hypothetical protein
VRQIPALRTDTSTSPCAGTGTGCLASFNPPSRTRALIDRSIDDHLHSWYPRLLTKSYKYSFTNGKACFSLEG